MAYTYLITIASPQCNYVQFIFIQWLPSHLNLLKVYTYQISSSNVTIMGFLLCLLVFLTQQAHGPRLVAIYLIRFLVHVNVGQRPMISVMSTCITLDTVGKVTLVLKSYLLFSTSLEFWRSNILILLSSIHLHFLQKWSWLFLVISLLIHSSLRWQVVNP